MKNLLLVILFATSLISCTQKNTEQPVKPSNSALDSLRQSLLDTIARYDATVGLAVIELETGDTLSINNHIPFAMQSVFKFPLALAVLNEVEKGNIFLGQGVAIPKKLFDRFSWSPLKKQNPGRIHSMSVDSLMMYAISYSDNLATDVLFEHIGGTQVVDSFTREKGYPGIQIKYNEIEIGEDYKYRMYQNSSIPSHMAGLLKDFFERKILNDSATKYLLDYMIHDSTSHKRLIGNLPAGTVVAHKTGTGNNDTFIHACNDVGIIYLPNGKHLAMAVFVMNSGETMDTTEKIIAVLTRQVYDYYNH